ncbi:MAG: pentapeptide repeat-containing protein [Cyanobacteria bacterium J06649_4]
MKAKELRNRYRQGERNFREVNLSGENLQGMDLQGIDLSNADLSKTGLQGTNFTRALLVRAKFDEATTGAKLQWSVPVLVLVVVVALLAAIVSGAGTAWCIASAVDPSRELLSVDGAFLQRTTGISQTVLVIAALYLGYRHGSLAMLSTIAMSVIAALLMTIIGSGLGSAEQAGSAGGLVAQVVTIIVVANGILILAGAITKVALDLEAFIASAAVFLLVALAAALSASVGATGDGTITESRVLPLLLFTFLVVTASVALSFLIGHRAIEGSPQDKVFRDVAVGLWALGGTTFQEADLTEATFFNSTIKNSHFKETNITRTQFHQVRKLHLSRTYRTILSDRSVLNLLVSLRPEPGCNYTDRNLRGSNLRSADLAGVDLAGADLSNATLAKADLQRANLTEVQALNTNFHEADLTAACIESWNIDSTTQLGGAICEHIYLLNNQQERRPNSGSFAPDEFAKLFEEVLNTVDLIFRDGIDWRAFMQTFKTIQIEQSGTNLEIQSIEKKGDGVMVVRLNTAPDADKPAIHQAFKADYQQQVALLEQEYRARLQSQAQIIQHKDEIIKLHRQQSADMMRITESMASRPIAYNVTATASSKSVEGNDESRTINIGGNVDNSALIAGENNTAGAKDNESRS